MRLFVIYFCFLIVNELTLIIAALVLIDFHPDFNLSSCIIGYKTRQGDTLRIRQIHRQFFIPQGIDHVLHLVYIFWDGFVIAKIFSGSLSEWRKLGFQLQFSSVKITKFYVNKLLRDTEFQFVHVNFVLSWEVSIFFLYRECCIILCLRKRSRSSIQQNYEYFVVFCSPFQLIFIDTLSILEMRQNCKNFSDAMGNTTRSCGTFEEVWDGTKAHGELSQKRKSQAIQTACWKKSKREREREIRENLEGSSLFVCTRVCQACL